MSGHSKWHNIQGRKGKQDALKGSIFSKLSKGITIAVRTGGGDMETNFALRLLADKARAAGMPKENVERAIKKGTGELNDGAQVEESLYEGYGPGGVAILVKSISDNKNRSVSDIKHILSSHGGSMGGAGSVLWMFEHSGVVHIAAEALQAVPGGREAWELALIDAGAENITEADGMVEVVTKMDHLQKLVNAVKQLNVVPAESGLQWMPKDTVPVPDDKRESLMALFSALEEHDDVDNYWTNAG